MNAIAGPARARFTLSLRCPHDADLGRRRYGVPVGGIGWREAWHQALYGPSGFYRAPSGPAGHFTTATHGPLGPVLAGALLQLAQDEGCKRIVDVGCGRGELLAQVRRLDPDIALTGVDVVDRPRHLTSGIDWLASPGGEDLPDRLDRLESALVVAHEWLDVVPCHIAEVDDDQLLREVCVDPATGEESLGSEVGGELARRGRSLHAEATQGGPLVQQLVVVEAVHGDVGGQVAGPVRHWGDHHPLPVCREGAA